MALHAEEEESIEAIKKWWHENGTMLTVVVVAAGDEDVIGATLLDEGFHVFDHRPEAANFLNLAALCQRCHNRHDAKHRRRDDKTLNLF